MKTVRLAWIALVAVALILALAASTPAQTAGEQPEHLRVWVTFQPGSKAQVENALRAQQAEFHYTFDRLDSFVVTLPGVALEGIRRNPNVLLVEEDVKRSMFDQQVPYGIDMVQARDVWDANRDGKVDKKAPTGAGQLVCVIDSGVYTGHEDLQTVNFVGGYPDGWDTDYCGHGTHVTGTITAANNALGVVGVTPGAVSIYMVKVFGDDCLWTYASTLVDAAYRCQAAGADIISMSLGGTGMLGQERRAFDDLYRQGILSIAAAGNDGDPTFNYPASYDSVVSVAAIDAHMLIADFSQYNNQVELAAPGVGVLSTVPFVSTNTLTVDGMTYSGYQIEFAAYTDGVSGVLADGGLCAATGDWAGKVVLCQRGDISFYEKVMNVQNSGGAAAVIYNNVPGDFLGTLGEGSSSLIPAISLSQEAGLALVPDKIGLTGTVVSSQPVVGSGYEAWDGTSMATPHVSGVAALLWSANPKWTNAQIRGAMTATALDLGAPGWDKYYGYGLVQAKAALDYLGGVPGKK